MAGSRRQREPGVWELRASAGFDPVTGKRRQVSRTFRGSERAAGVALAELVAEVARGGHAGTASTFARLLDDWLELVDRDLEQTTAYGYRRKVERYVRPTLGGVRLDRLTARDFDRLYGALGRKRGDEPPVGARTIRQVHAICRRACDQGVRWGILSDNPAAKATPPRVDAGHVRPPTTEAVGLLLARADAEDPVLGMAIRLAAAMGCRRGELVGLRWGHVDLDTGVVLVSRTVTEVGGRLVEKGTKTRQERRVRLDPVTLERLIVHEAACRQRCGVAGVRWRRDGHVLSLEPDGSVPYPPDRLTRRFAALRDELELPAELHLHDLRHWHASALLDAGLPLPAVAARLGHAQTSTTANIYSHPLGDVDGRAAGAIGGVLDRKGGDDG